MFSMHRSQKNIEQKGIDYKALYLEERRLKQQFQKRVQMAQLKYRKLSQSFNKKCVRCMNIDDKKTKQQQIQQLKLFRDGLNQININTLAQIPQAERMGGSNILENFGVFGIPQSMLVQPEHQNFYVQGQLLYVSNIPSISEQNTARICFPNGITPKYFCGLEAKQKAIQIMSSSCTFAQSFIMSFENSEIEQPIKCQVKRLMNPENRLYAVCITVEDFTLVPNQDQMQNSISVASSDEISSAKNSSCQDTDISYHTDKECNIIVTPRVYCIFSSYPFFSFYQQVLKAIVNSVKTERLVIYRENGCSIGQADSHFFLDRVKQTYRQISQQIQYWQPKFMKQFQLKLMSCQKIPLNISHELCSNHFIQEWGLSILNMFTVDTFIDVLTLILLEEKVVFVSDNSTILTFAVHLFSQLLPRPFQYFHTVINMLAQCQEFFQNECPYIYGYASSKNNLLTHKIVQKYSKNVFVVLQREAQVLSKDSKKSVLKKRPKLLHSTLSTKFKADSNKNRRVSNLTFMQQQVSYMKDKQGICNEILKDVSNYLNEQILKNMPKHYQVAEIVEQCQKSAKKGQNISELAMEKIKKICEKKSKEDFYRGMLETQIIAKYLFR